jgi:hypothetical protein
MGIELFVEFIVLFCFVTNCFFFCIQPNGPAGLKIVKLLEVHRECDWYINYYLLLIICYLWIVNCCKFINDFQSLDILLFFLVGRCLEPMVAHLYMQLFGKIIFLVHMNVVVYFEIS